LHWLTLARIHIGIDLVEPSSGEVTLIWADALVTSAQTARAAVARFIHETELHFETPMKGLLLQAVRYEVPMRGCEMKPVWLDYPAAAHGLPGSTYA